MTVPLSNGVYVPDPFPRTIRYGLFAVAQGPMEMPSHGGDSGVTYLAAVCGEADGYEVHCVVDSNQEKGPFTDGLDVGRGSPFVVNTGFECGLVGISNAERDRFVLQKLHALEQGAVEKIFSEGTFGISPSLAHGDNVATLDASSNVTEAFMRLQENFYNTYGFPGTIHVPHLAGPLVKGARLIEREDGIWTTAAGSQVSIGNYSGLSPDGNAPAAGNTWLYITPPIAIWRDPDVFVSPIEGALNRTNNEVTMLAEREYVLAHDPCPVFATQTQLLEAV